INFSQPVALHVKRIVTLFFEFFVPEILFVASVFEGSVFHSDSGKTTMLLNLLIGTKMVDKENGSRYILCNDVILIETEDVSFKALPPSEIPDTDEFNPE
ncbi:12185_t:CDS:2, partial [Entrophospora sp. SA101]